MSPIFEIWAEGYRLEDVKVEGDVWVVTEVDKSSQDVVLEEVLFADGEALSLVLLAITGSVREFSEHGSARGAKILPDEKGKVLQGKEELKSGLLIDRVDTSTFGSRS